MVTVRGRKDEIGISKTGIIKTRETGIGVKTVTTKMEEIDVTETGDQKMINLAKIQRRIKTKSPAENRKDVIYIDD